MYKRQISFPWGTVELAGVKSNLEEKAEIFVTEDIRKKNLRSIYLFVHCPTSVPFEGGAALTLYFDVYLSAPNGALEEEGIEISRTTPARAEIPLQLEGDGTSWISVEGFTPLFPVPILNAGKISVDVATGVWFASIEALRGEVAELPIELTTVEPVSYLTVGIDYDEDMIEILAVALAPEIAPEVESVYLIRKQPGRAVLVVRAKSGGFRYPVTRLPFASLLLWINPAAQPGATLRVGPADSADVLVDGNPMIHTAVYSQGEIHVKENLQSYFIRGDANLDGKVNTSDPVSILAYLFGGQADVCVDACDVNDDGAVNLCDASLLLGYLFGEQATLPPPFPKPGLDPTYDELPGCAQKGR